MDKRNEIIEKVNQKISRYLNYSVEDLKTILGIKSKAKSINYIIISKMLDLNDFDAETLVFLKNFSVIKTVNLTENNKVIESMSFPTIDYYDMINNNWESSAVYKYFSTRTIVIFIFKKINLDTKFIGVKYLNLSKNELEQIKIVWSSVKNMIKENKLKIGGKGGYSVENFPKKEDNPVTHIRPHDSNSLSGKVLLPNGERIIKYCFWLNNNFIEKKVKETGEIYDYKRTF